MDGNVNVQTKWKKKNTTWIHAPTDTRTVGHRHRHLLLNQLFKCNLNNFYKFILSLFLSIFMVIVREHCMDHTHTSHIAPHAWNAE